MAPRLHFLSRPARGLSRPDMGDRYYIFEVVDLWMSDSESSPSTRTAGGTQLLIYLPRLERDRAGRDEAVPDRVSLSSRGGTSPRDRPPRGHGLFLRLTLKPLEAPGRSGPGAAATIRRPLALHIKNDT
jgi:hypothetical protein